MLVDLKYLEKNRITGEHAKWNGQSFLLVIILVHMVSVGLLKTSGCQYFCRYCEIMQSQFESDDLNVCGPQHTPESYDTAVGDLQAEDS